MSRGASRTLLRIGCALACVPCRPLTAQVLDLAQYAHTAFRVEDGAPGAIRDLAQGADGVLWIASERGLFQFDGIRFERFAPPPGQALLPHGAQFLLALPDTSLWVGHFTSGVSVVHGDSVMSYDTQNGLPGGTVTSIARDSGGTMWVATTRGLARLAGRRWEQMDTAAGFPGGFTGRVLVDRSGSVWAMAGSEIYLLPRGATRFRKWQNEGAGNGGPRAGPLIAAPDGSVWGVHKSFGVFPVADPRGAPLRGTLVYADTGIYDLVWSSGHPAVALGTQGRLLRLWLPDSTTSPASVSQAGRPRALAIPFSRAVGMSGNLVFTARYDREGSLWVGTPNGIDRFRETKLTPLRLPGYLDSPGVAADTNGIVWISARRGTPSSLLRVGDRIVARPDAPSMVTCIYRDLRGVLWVGGAGLWERRGDALAPVPLPPVPPRGSPYGREVQAIALERDEGLWVAMAYEGVFRRKPGRSWEGFGPPGLERAVANVITSDSSGRTWLGYPEGQLVLVVGDSVRLFQPQQLALGRVLAISVYGDRVWVGGQAGVATLDARKVGAHAGPFAVLRTAGEPLRGISGLIETADGDLWLNGADGVTRIPAPELRHAFADPSYPVHSERLDYRDGLEPPAQLIRPLPSAVAGTDGRLWFASEGGIAWVDPHRVRRNTIPPPVHLLALTAGGRRYFPPPTGDTIRLLPRTGALSVAYTAYSLAVPDRVRFKYRLDGLDTTWQDAGARREAFFTNLRPGRYRFRVIASNDDGLWNMAGASLAFTIAPAWNQTWWFFALVALALVATPALIVSAWQRRRAHLRAERTQARFDAILTERTRVARELHDTLLGGMVGVVLQIESVARRLATGDSNPAAAADLLTTLGSQAREALTHTRQSVGGMRATQTQPLHEELASAAERAFSGTDIVVHLTQTGTEKPYPKMLEAEIVSIAAEALANARNHSGCTTVWVTCDYGTRELRVVIRDDGRGFDSSRASPTGHWGLIGMRERATAIGAVLTITSTPGAGTELVLVLRERVGLTVLWQRLGRAAIRRKL